MGILTQTVPVETELTALAATLGQRLLDSGLRLATAESCTGGWVAKLVTDTAGSSAWFDRGFVTYSNEAKQDLLGVPAETLQKHGAVSAETAAMMVQGALNRSRAEWTLAITGIAGPGGGTATKPVGLVWFGWGRRGGAVTVASRRFDGDRAAIRQQAAQVAIQGLLDRLP